MQNGVKINFHLVYNIVQYYQLNRCKLNTNLWAYVL